MASEQPERILGVAQAITLCNLLLADLVLTVEGEVSSFSISRGKFVFFDLKDENEEARLSCFMMSHQLNVPIEDGMRVVVTARPGLYQKSGSFRLSVLRVEPRGEGSVRRAFELLKAKLDGEGMFSRERKRELPRIPRLVGIVSSREAAGYGDFIKIAFARLPGVRFLLANVAVQGKEAEGEIVRALDHLNESYVLDAIVLIRGGGSMEDLHAFNSEPVARAIVRSRAPVLVGVGHEKDITIADYCADVRAATPSNAAQLLLPEAGVIRSQVISLVQGGHGRMLRHVQLAKERTVQRVTRMHQLLAGGIAQRRTLVEGRLRTIEALSPERTLQRGYSLTWRADGSLLDSVAKAAPGEALVTQLADGRLHSTVTSAP